jgi:hypothetical protein
MYRIISAPHAYDSLNNVYLLYIIYIHIYVCVCVCACVCVCVCVCVRARERKCVDNCITSTLFNFDG